jgi:hypothetical protein
MPFVCSICEQESTQICEYCTKDTCADHLCASCLRCSDCCECDVPLTAKPNGIPVVADQTQAELVPTEAVPELEEDPRPEAVPAQEKEQDQDPAPEAGA